MIGLKRGTIELHDHDENWHKIAVNTMNDLKIIFGDIAIDIQHVGSTSIHSICAKPIIDISVGVSNLSDVQSILDKLEENGYMYKSENNHKDQIFFSVGDISKDLRTSHIHVVKHNEVDWNNYISFRDYLNNNYKMAKKYEKLKFELLDKFKNNRIKYTDGKTGLIEKILQEAKDTRKNNKSSSLEV